MRIRSSGFESGQNRILCYVQAQGFRQLVMQPQKPYSHHLIWQIWHQARRLVPLASLGLLTACMASSSYSDDVMQPPSNGATANTSDANSAAATYTPQPSPSPSQTAQFNFPLGTCGEQSSQPSGTWYSIFIDNGDVNQIRSRYCGDAISTTREKSGTPTVQVASFTSYAKALALAKAVGGVVEQTAQQTASSTGSSSGSYQSADRPAASPAPAASAASAAPAIQVGQSAYLSASDPNLSINIRGSASTDAAIQSSGVSGDRVQISNSAQGKDGFTWYEVRLDSGTAGWVRGDLIAAQAPAVNRSANQSANQSGGSPPSYTSPSARDQPSSAPPYAQAPYGQPPYGQPPYGGQAPPAQPSYPPAYGQPSYGQPPYGQGGYGMNRNSTLTSRDPGSAINVREYASPNSRVRYHGNPGDPVRISGAAQGEDGFTWYQVQFPSGAGGWVRSDLIMSN